MPSPASRSNDTMRKPTHEQHKNLVTAVLALTLGWSTALQAQTLDDLKADARTRVMF
jgi:hypothetical protein